jgi:hypothetical protein
MTARFEVWFLSGDQISVFIETSHEAGPIGTHEMLEAAVFASIAAGVIANLPKDRATILCERLADLPVPSSRDDIPTSVDGLDLVLPQPEGGRKGCYGTFRMKRGLPVARLKFRGFRRFGDPGVQDCAQTATMAVLHDLVLGFSPIGRVVLVEAAHALGNLGLTGAIKMTTHPRVAMAALDQAIEAAERHEAEAP